MGFSPALLYNVDNFLSGKNGKSRSNKNLLHPFSSRKWFQVQQHFMMAVNDCVKLKQVYILNFIYLFTKPL